ncbi:MAG TPA: cysteine dioxygenase family protein [Gaiellaceae bacterium]|nr:cysteine dioxygenase family protein [Gaiellaceae bacterium]
MPSAIEIPAPSSTTTASFLSGRIPSGRNLSRFELRALAATVGNEPDLWQAHVSHDPNQRNYTQLYRDPQLDIWLICWTNQQDTGFHDHDRSAGAVQIVEGELVEDRFEFSGSTLRETSTTHREGATFDFDASHVHRLRHHLGAVATSIHAYSPALWRMGYYDPDPAGLLRRTSISYAEELVPAV